jgi:hypothetical protein
MILPRQRNIRKRILDSDDDETEASQPNSVRYMNNVSAYLCYDIVNSSSVGDRL